MHMFSGTMAITIANGDREMLARIIDHDDCQDIMLDIGTSFHFPADALVGILISSRNAGPASKREARKHTPTPWMNVSILISSVGTTAECLS